ncbi:MAG: phosphotransferase [Myxococcota bacterium]
MIESAVESALQALGLPPPRSMRPIRMGTARTFEVGLVRSAPVWVRIPHDRVGVAALRREEAVVRLLGGTAVGGQIPDPYSVVAVGDLCLAVLPRPAGAPASEALGTDATALSRAVGAWLARVPATSKTHGTDARGGRFLREHRSWPGSVAAELQRIRGQLARVGWGLGDLESTLAERVLTGLSTLEGVPAYAPVHRDLGPDRVYVEGGAITGVVDWERAWLADPLMQWAPLLVQPSVVLGPMLEGFGAQGVARLQRNLARLEVYVAFGILERYAARVLSAVDENARAAASGLAQHEAGVAARGVDAILGAAEPAGGVWPGWAPDADRLVLRRALHRMAVDGDHVDARLEQILAAALLARQSGEPEATAWRTLALRALAALPTFGAPEAGPTDDLLDRALTAPGPFASAATTAWLVRAASEITGPVDPAVHAAAARRVERSLCIDEQPRMAPPAQTLHHLVLGLAAAQGTPWAHAWRERLDEEWSALEPTSGPEIAPRSPTDAPPDLDRAPALLALRTIPTDQLPAPANAVLDLIAGS